MDGGIQNVQSNNGSIKNQNLIKHESITLPAAVFNQHLAGLLQIHCLYAIIMQKVYWNVLLLLY